MSRKLSPALRAHLQQPVTTACRLLRITLRDGRAFGMTTLDRDVTYQGVTYSAANGFDPSIIATDTGLTVDNAEAYALLSADIPGITLEMVAAGDLDDAQWEMLLVNWSDLSMGHMILDAGDLGEVTISDGVAYAPELLSYAMRLRQSIGHFWSRTCRAVFGTDAEGQTGCGVDVSSMWIEGTVTGVASADRFRVFADSALQLDPVPSTARVQWLSGPNAGSRLYQVEGYSPVSGTIALIEPVPFPIAEGHDYRFREDCDKTPANCKANNNFLNYKGEPLIPVGDSQGIMTPQASIPGAFMGSEIVE